jgi:hypothetical protein
VETAHDAVRLVGVWPMRDKPTVDLNPSRNLPGPLAHVCHATLITCTRK